MGLMLNNQPIKGEVHLGKQTIGKMYYNHELVYENMLPSGTVVFDETLNMYDSTTRKITLKNVKVGMTNISKGLNVNFRIIGIRTYKKFVSVDDLKNGIIIIDSGANILKLAWEAGTNQLNLKKLSMSDIELLKLTVA